MRDEIRGGIRNCVPFSTFASTKYVIISCVCSLQCPCNYFFMYSTKSELSTLDFGGELLIIRAVTNEQGQSYQDFFSDTARAVGFCQSDWELYNLGNRIRL